MKTSDSGVAFIAGQESFIATPYKDFAGKLTIGYGHLLRDGERHPLLSEATAMALLRLDLAGVEHAINTMVAVELSQLQFDALASFVFNEGTGHFTASTLLRLLNEGRYEDAAQEFQRWDKYSAGGVMKSSPTLRKRRMAEMAMFVADIEAAKPPRNYTENVQHANVIQLNRKPRGGGDAA